MSRYPWMRNPLYPDVLSAVYRLYDAAGRLLYVGVCYDFVKRFNQHRNKAYWWSEVAHKDVVLFETRIDAMCEEARAIEEEHLIHNGRPGFSRYAWTVIRTWRGTVTEPKYDMLRVDLEKRIAEVQRTQAHVLVSYDAELEGALVPWEWYLRACEASGETREEVMASLAPRSE